MTEGSGRLRHISLDLTDQEEALRRNLYEVLAEAASRTVGKGGRVLDVGAGRGELMKNLQKKGCRTFGVDVEPGCVKAAARFGKCRRGKIEDVPKLFPDEKFDAVVCSHVLEHLDSPHQALGQLARLRAGHYFFAVPNLFRPVRVLRSFLGLKKGDHPEHVHSWGHAEFASLLSRCGFAGFQWYGDRVTVNPLRGKIGAILTRCLSPLEERFLPLAFPLATSSIIVGCRLAKRG